MADHVIQNSLAWIEDSLRSTGELKQSDLFGQGDKKWDGATIDSRRDCNRRLFFAMTGVRTDGHRYIDAAADNGATAVVLEDGSATHLAQQRRLPFFFVSNTLTALQRLATTYRNTLKVRVVAVTGSAGKTTTKEYIRMILKKKYKAHSNSGNYNNHIGVPLTILETDLDQEYLVSEVGANHIGEVEFLSKMLRPDVALITNIGDAHIGEFGSREHIAQAKSEIFSGVDDEGCAVLPEDSDFIDFLKAQCRCRVVTFGHSDRSTFRASLPKKKNDHLMFDINGESLSIKSYGRFNVLNACAAYAVGDLCGVESPIAREALAEIEPAAGRARIHRGNGITLIDDSYNANPSSMKASLEALDGYAAKRRIAILGEMGELGVFAQDAHREIGRFVGSRGIDILAWIGQHSGDVADGLPKSGTKFLKFDDLDAAYQRISSELQSGDIVLVKASRALELDVLVSRLRKGVLE